MNENNLKEWMNSTDYLTARLLESVQCIEKNAHTQSQRQTDHQLNQCTRFSSWLKTRIANDD